MRRSVRAIGVDLYQDSRDEAQLIIIYGKRRVGKTELSIQFAKNKPHIYFLCERIDVRRQLKKFTESIGQYFKDEFLPQEGFKDWKTSLKYISQKNKKIAVVIDEFPYLVETEGAVPSYFSILFSEGLGFTFKKL